MRVLHTIASIDPATGGPARSVPQLMLALKKVGCDVGLWTSRPAEPAWKQSLEQVGIPVYSGDLGLLPRFDLIHDHGLWLPSNHQVKLHAARAGVARIVSPRGMLEPWALKHKKWKKRVAWWLYQRNDLREVAALHATAESEAKQFRALGLKVPVIVLPNGVAIPESWDRKTRVKGQDSEIRRQDQLSRPPAPKTALFLSRIHAKKGLPMLVAAWNQVRPAGWRMRVVGPDEGGHRAELEAMVRKAGLAAEWSFEGPIEGDEKWNAFHEAELFVLPTYSENFGIAVAEALASGLPVITTTGAPWQGLHAHRCGWWVPPEVEALTVALQEATRLSTAERSQMGDRGRAWVADDFVWTGIATHMMAAYHEIIARPLTSDL